MLNPSRNRKRNTRSVKSIQTRLTKRTLQKSSRSTRNTITGVPWDGHARERVQPASGPVMADDCPLLQQRSKHGPESGPHGFRCADSPRSTRMRLLVLSSLGCERSRVRAAVWTAWISTKSVETTREPLVPESLAERSFRGKEGVGRTR